MSSKHDGRSADLARPWWASRWVAVLESFGIASRLERGRRYARAGRVLRLEIEVGRVDALVQGTRYEPYKVRFRVKKLTDRQWDKAFDALASRAKYSAMMLAGQMPHDIEEALQSAGLTLFPASARELKVSCTCPDIANPCKHAAAVHFALGDQFDQDPFLLFHLRGRSREHILRALRTRRAAGATGGATSPRQAGPVSASPDRFWLAGESLESVAISVGPPKVSAALLKRLGVPPFWKAHPEIRGALERLYAKVTERAMALAYGGQGSDSLRDEHRH